MEIRAQLVPELLRQPFHSGGDDVTGLERVDELDAGAACPRESDRGANVMLGFRPQRGTNDDGIEELVHGLPPR